MKILITGGAGFIGSNLAAELSKKHKVIVFDSLDRGGSEINLEWLRLIEGTDKEARSPRFVKGGITDRDLVEKLVRQAEVVLHLAAQVAVTTSVENPRRDFEVNALGTFNVMEAVRQTSHKPLVVYSSTNKVYGQISERGLEATDSRYVDKMHSEGIDENQQLDFYSPYGSSKGSADSYVKDYGRIYGLPTVVLRKSCVYGVRQFGTEDQGWVAHFVRAALQRQPITVYGDGKQVRDLLYIGDLIRLYEKIISRYKEERREEQGDRSERRYLLQGKVYNVGGGKENAVSLLELIRMLEQQLGHEVEVDFSDWRPGDQKVYISDIAKVKKELGWEPRTGVEEGLKQLINWIKEAEI